MKVLSPKIIFFLFTLLLFTGVMNGQDDSPPDGPKQQFDRPPQGQVRPNLMRELGLSREQIQQFRRMNRERKPLMDEAVRRLREANRDLDIAIYSDNLNDEDVAAKLTEFQSAQAEVAKLRFQGELAVRKILTPEQLVRFRELRRRFAEARENFQERRQKPVEERQPLRQIDRLQRQLPRN